jgi:hypothetical protein
MTISSTRLLKLLKPGLSYLEIGIANGSTFKDVSSVHENCWGCDPNLMPSLAVNGSLWNLTSDEFFRQVSEPKFDVFFIDGLHTAEQAMTDFVNCVNRSNIGGLILIDDVFPDSIPSSKRSLSLYRFSRALNLINSGLKPVGWQGDVWRLISALQSLQEDLRFRTIYSQNGDKCQTLVWGPSIGRTVLDVEKCILMLPPRGKPIFELFGRQPRSAEEIPNWFNPETFSQVLELIK